MRAWMTAIALLTMATTAMAQQAQRSYPSGSRLTVEKREGKFILAVPISRLVLSLPQGGLVNPGDQPRAGATDNPRYFKFEDPAQGLIISGWFEPAEKFAGLESFWKGEVESWRRNQLPEPRNTIFERIDHWQVVEYELAVPGVINSHLRAHWVEAGTWIDVHLSMTSRKKKAEDCRAALRKWLYATSVRVKSPPAT